MSNELMKSKPYMPSGMSVEVATIRESRSKVFEVGTGGGGDSFLKIDHNTGVMTFGMENTPLPEDKRRFVVPAGSLMHGYIVNVNGKPVERHMIPFFGHSERPTPPGGRYVEYGQDGPRSAMELVLNSIDEPGLSLTFTSWSVSHDNRLRKLIELTINHADVREAEDGFVHPVILLKAGSYFSHKKKADLYHFDFEHLGWLHNDGKRFSGEIAVEFEYERMLWEDEDVTAAESEVFSGRS